jgi:RNA polymerase sigma factor (sigma-70 family)
VTDDEEAQSIAAARAGDLRAFGRLVDTHQAPVRAFLRRLTGNWADADDIAQDAFARAWELLHRLDRGASLKPFVVGIAYQLWRRHRRGLIRRLARDGGYAELTEMERQTPPDAESRIALHRALQDLPLDQRAALAMCLGAEFTHAEAAAALGLPLGTVKSHVSRGRDRLQRILGDTPAKNAHDE